MKCSFNEIHFEEIDSTSAYLKREHNNLKNLTIVSASFQTNGRGRLDRNWISDKNANLLFSVLLKDGDLLSSFPYLSLGAAYAVTKGLIELGISNVKVKWPNDVYVNGKKICGILLEGSLPEYLVIGIGLNVNQTTFPSDLRHPGTSFCLESGKYFTLDEIKAKIYPLIKHEFFEILANRHSFLTNLKDFDFLAGKIVEAEIEGKIKKIVVQGINNDCSLLVSYDGKTESLKSGEIKLI